MQPIRDITLRTLATKCNSLLTQTHYHPAVVAITRSINGKNAPQNHGVAFKVDVAATKAQELLRTFGNFQEHGFSLNPRIVMPGSVVSGMRRINSGKKVYLDGPSVHGSLFMDQIEKKLE